MRICRLLGSAVVAGIAGEAFGAFAPALPVYREDALSPALRQEIVRETPERLARLKERLVTLRDRVKVELPANSFQFVRTAKRMEIASRALSEARKELARGATDGLAFACLYVEDLTRFSELFEDELSFFKCYPLAPGVRPDVIRVEDYGAKGDGMTDNTEAFDRAFAAAASRRGKPVVIDVPKGDFLFAPATNRTHVRLTDLTNVVLRGVSPKMTRLRFGNTECAGVMIAGGANVTVCGMELASVETPFFQGTVERFDKEGGWAIVRWHPGTVRPDDPRFTSGEKMQFCLGIFDETGHMYVKDMFSLFYDRRAEEVGRGLFKVYLQREHYAYKRPCTRLEPGWSIVIPLRKAFVSNATIARGAYLCNFADVWIRNGRCSAVNFCSEARYASAWRVKVFPFDGLLASSGADGIMNHRGTFIGECEFIGLNDDGANCYSLGRRIQRVEGDDTIIGQWLPCGYRAGDFMQVVSGLTGQYLYLGRVAHAGGAGVRSGFQSARFESALPKGLRSVESLKLPPPSSEERRMQVVAGLKVDAAREPDMLYRPYMFGVGHVVYKTRFSSLRGSGAVLACPNALLEDVTYEHLFRGVSLSSLGNGEGPAPYNVTIRNCLFRQCLTGIEGRCMTGVGKKFKTAPIRGLVLDGNSFESVASPLILDNVAEDVRIIERPAAVITVDPTTEAGPVKPVNGVGQPPMIGAPTSFDLMPYLKEAGIPYARLHDVGGPYGGLRYVDIPNLFRDFDADETRPENYSFAYTDALMRALAENGVEPFFRLGITIDNPVNAGYPGYFVDPPKDYAKWARICEHVIRHYTEGWANGFRMKVGYWEIWNEPDNEPNPARNPLWNAPFSKYVRLYGTVASHLKAKFPHLKIGGYGSCGFYAAVGASRVAAGNSSPRLTYFIDCATNFLSAVRSNGWPLDFFSFHSYSKPSEALKQVAFADRLLADYGFPAGKTARVFNEWLPFAGRQNAGTAQQAAAVAAELIGLQNGPCDIACIYDARCATGDYSPLFDPRTYTPRKAYSAYVAFNELRRLGTAVRCRSTDGEIAVAAASKDGRVAVMLANPSDRSVRVSFVGVPEGCLWFVTDETRTHRLTDAPDRLPPHSFFVAVKEPVARSKKQGK